VAERIAPVLGLEGVEVKEAVERGGGWEIEVEVALPGRCASCGGKVHGHGRLPRRRVSHLWIGAKTVRLSWVPRRGQCSQCRRTVTTRPVGLERWQRLTPRAKEIALLLLRRQSFRTVAQDLGVSFSSLTRLLESSVTLDDRCWWQIPGELVLSVDEHSFRGTDLMITIALRSPLKRLLTILPDDRMASLAAWLKELPTEVRDRIRVVSTDLKVAYRKVFAQLCHGRS
jgi:transposase